MKNVTLKIIIIFFLLSGCVDSNSSNNIYLKCKTIKNGLFITHDYGKKIGDIKYFEINLKDKKIKTQWDKKKEKFNKNQKILSVDDKYIKIQYKTGKNSPDKNYEILERKTGQLTHKRLSLTETKQTPIAICEKITKKELPIK